MQTHKIEHHFLLSISPTQLTSLSAPTELQGAPTELQGAPTELQGAPTELQGAPTELCNWKQTKHLLLLHFKGSFPV